MNVSRTRGSPWRVGTMAMVPVCILSMNKSTNMPLLYIKTSQQACHLYIPVFITVTTANVSLLYLSLSLSLTLPLAPLTFAKHDGHIPETAKTSELAFPIAICCASARQNCTSPSQIPGSASTRRGFSDVSPTHRGSSTCQCQQKKKQGRRGASAQMGECRLLETYLLEMFTYNKCVYFLGLERKLEHSRVVCFADQARNRRFLLC